MTGRRRPRKSRSWKGRKSHGEETGGATAPMKKKAVPILLSAMLLDAMEVAKRWGQKSAAPLGAQAAMPSEVKHPSRCAWFSPSVGPCAQDPRWLRCSRACVVLTTGSETSLRVTRRREKVRGAERIRAQRSGLFQGESAANTNSETVPSSPCFQMPESTCAFANLSTPRPSFRP